MADQNRQQEGQLTIEILNEAPIKSEDIWELTIWAIAKRGNNFLEGLSARFLCSAKEIGTETTNSDGHTNPLLVAVPANKTSIQIEVFVEDNRGRMIYKKKEIIFPRPATLDKRADEWSTRVVGSEGEYKAYISVTGQNQLPLPGILIHVYFDRGTQLAGDAYTDKDGLAVIAIPQFTEPFKDIIIEAVGTRIKPEKKRLYRRHNQTPPPVPEPKNTDQTSGLRNILKAFRRGWKSGEQTMRDQNKTQ